MILEAPLGAWLKIEHWSWGYITNKNSYIRICDQLVTSMILRQYIITISLSHYELCWYKIFIILIEKAILSYPHGVNPKHKFGSPNHTGDSSPEFRCTYANVKYHPLVGWLGMSVKTMWSRSKTDAAEETQLELQAVGRLGLIWPWCFTPA